MSYYRVCPGCGANLDPGEICEDYLETERGARATNTDAQREESINSIYYTILHLKNQIKENEK